jgi:thioredoxin-like negative regulator of GroEL
MHTYITLAKMAAENKQRVDDALETLLSIMGKSGKMRKDLKNYIHESVSSLRKAFILIYKQLDKVKEEYNSYRKKVNNTMKGE